LECYAESGYQQRQGKHRQQHERSKKPVFEVLLLRQLACDAAPHLGRSGSWPRFHKVECRAGDLVAGWAGSS
jgi:hypothetical protein